MLGEPLNIVIGPLESIADPDIIPPLPWTLFFILKSVAPFVLFLIILELIILILIKWIELGFVHDFHLLDVWRGIHKRNLFILIVWFLVKCVSVVMYGKVLNIIMLDVGLWDWALNQVQRRPRLEWETWLLLPVLLRLLGHVPLEIEWLWVLIILRQIEGFKGEGCVRWIF